MKILLVEPELQLRNSLASMLVEHHHVVDLAQTGQEGWDLLQIAPYDLVILDVILPGADGMDFCRRVKQYKPDILIMFLTEQNDQADRIAGFDAGADDYLSKPCDPEELVARVRVLQRRNFNVSPAVQYGKLRLEPDRRRIFYEDQPLQLRPKEYAILELFLRHPHRIFSRREIFDILWGCEDCPPDEATIKAHVKNIRHALRTVGAENLIQTLYGRGYGLNSPALVAKVPSPESKAERTQAIVSQIWQQVRGLNFERLRVLQQTAIALKTGDLSEDLHYEALQSAHHLVGAFSMFGFSEGSKLAQQIEKLLEANTLFDLDQIQQAETLIDYLQQYLQWYDEAQLLQADADQASGSKLAAIKVKVLAIGTDQTMLTLLHELLLPLGIEIVAQLPSKKIVQVLEQIRPDLVLFDAKMPEVSGLELCRMIRSNRQWQWLPIIFLTSCQDVHTQRQVFEMGADDCVMKPVIPSVLATRIFNRINRFQMIQQHAVNAAYPSNNSALA